MSQRYCSDGQKTTDLPLRPRWYFTAFTVALGTGVFAGFLNFLRPPPLGSLPGELFALLSFCIAAVMVLPILPKRFAVAPILLLLPATLATLIGIQFALGRYTYLQFPLLWLGYLALAVLAMVVGQGILTANLAAETTRRLAWALLLVGVGNSVIQVLQSLHLESAMRPFVLNSVGCSFYGNAGQANHASTLAWMAVASALHLNGAGRLRPRWAVPVIAVLLLGSALSGSRMAWLFLAVTVVLVLAQPSWMAQDRRRRGLIAVMLIGGFLLANYAWGWSIASYGVGCTTSLQRLGDLRGAQEAGLLIRMELWRQAADVWRTSPWTGVGAYNVLPTVYAIELPNVHRTFDRYVHNIGLQILAEFGVIGFAALLAVGLTCVRRIAGHWRQLQAADAVLLAWLAFIGIHSLLEYPLWYAHFLIAFCMALGMLVRPDWSRAATPRPFRLAVAALSLAGLVAAIGLFLDYRAVSQLYWLERQRSVYSGPRAPDLRPVIERTAAHVRFFRVEADQLLGRIELINSYDLQRKIADADRLLRIQPFPVVALRRALLAILAGDPETARGHLRRVFAFFPGEAEGDAAALRNFIGRQPEEAFAPLGPIVEQELARRPMPRWAATPRQD